MPYCIAFDLDAESGRAIKGSIRDDKLTIQQAVGVGELSSVVEARELVRRSVETETYEPGDTAAWDEAFGRYRQLTAQE